jgi:hypothetical protein
MAGVFQNVPVAQGSNRANSSGIAMPSQKNRTSIVHSDIIPAGGSKQFAAPGTQFYLMFTTAPLQIRPSAGTFNTYAVGQGLQLTEENAFNSVEFKNTTANAVVFQIFIGFDNFIDNTLIVNTVTNPSVAYPTYSTPSAAASVAITDKSGTPFSDINGGSWYAVNRVAIVISNVDSGVTLLLQKANSVIASGPAIVAIFPLTSIRLDVSGNYVLHLGGANINAIVSELYQAIAAT